MIRAWRPLVLMTISGSRAIKEKRANFSSPSTDSSKKEYLDFPANCTYADTGVWQSPRTSLYTGIKLPLADNFKNSCLDKKSIILFFYKNSCVCSCDRRPRSIHLHEQGITVAIIINFFDELKMPG